MKNDSTTKKPRKKFIQVPLPDAFQGTVPDALPGEEQERYQSPRVRAVKLRSRMAQFSEIYQAAWMVRHAQYGRPEYRQAKVEKFMRALKIEMEKCKDQEALMFAVADAITAFPYGLPWES